MNYSKHRLVRYFVVCSTISTCCALCAIITLTYNRLSEVGSSSAASVCIHAALYFSNDQASCP